MKTISISLLLTALVPGLPAQPIPVAPAASPPAPAVTAPAPTNQDDPVRAVLERAYAQVGGAPLPVTNRNIAPLVTNPAATATATATPTPTATATAAGTPPLLTLTNLPAAARVTNANVRPLAAATTNAVNPPTVAPITIAPKPTNATTRARQPSPPVPGVVEPAAPANTATAPSVAGAVAPGIGLPANPPGPGAAAAPAANAAANPDEEVFGPGFIKFNDADLVQVLEIYQELTGRTVLKPNSLPPAKITIRSQTQLTRREAIQALDSILSLNQITMIPQGDKFVKAVPQGQSFQEGAVFNDLPTELLPEAGVFTTMIYQLKNAVPNDVLPAIQPFSKLPNSIIGIPSSGILVLRDYAENVKRMVELLDKIDVVPLSDIENVVIPIKYALAADISQVLSSLTGGGGGTVSVGSSRQQGRGISGGSFGAGAGGLGGLGGLGGAGGIPGQPGYGQQQGLGGLGGAGLGGGAAGSRSSFQNRLSSAVNRAIGGGGGAGGGDIVVLGQTKIIADERTNSLLIFATKQDIETIKDIISKLDVVLAQVLIEALIMEVALGNELNYGVSYLQKDPSQKGSFTGIGAVRNKDVPFLNPIQFVNAGTNAGAGALGGGLSYFARFGGDMEASLVAAASDSRINILSRPRIQTSHAVQADLFVGTTRPYVTGTYSYFGGGPQTQFQQQQIGITLQVLPLINQEGLVVMDIHEKIQNVGRDIKIDANFSVPETIDREANAKVAVRDRETIMLGGFISDQRDTAKSGVPILKDIPIIGRLFSANSDKYQRAELIVLIRPTVLPTPQDASIFASEQRAKLPIARTAEKDFMEQERKLLKKADREFYNKEGFTK